MEACNTDAERAALRASRERVAGITAAAQAEAVARLHKYAAEHEAWLAAERQKRLDDEVAELGQFKRKPRASSAARPVPPAPGSNGAAAAGADAQATAAPASSGEAGTDPAAPALPYGTTLYYRSLVEAEAHAAQMRAIAQAQYSFRPAINARSARMARKSNAKIAAAIAAASAGEKSSSTGAAPVEEKTQLHQTDRAAPVKPRIVDSSRPNPPQLRVSKPLRSSSSASGLGAPRASLSAAAGAGAVYSSAPSAYKMKTLEKHAKDASKEMTFRPRINPPLARAHNGNGHASAAVAASKPATAAAVAAATAAAPVTPSPAAFQRSSSASPSPSVGGPSPRGGMDFLHVPPSFDLFDSPGTLLARPLSTLKESHSWSAGEFQLAREEFGSSAGAGLAGAAARAQPHRRALSTETWSLSPAAGAASSSSFAAAASSRARLSLRELELEEALRPQSARNASSSPSPSSLGRSTPRAVAGCGPEQLSARSSSTTTGTPRRASSSPRAETHRAHSASLSCLPGPGTGSASASGSGSGSGSNGASRPFLATHVSSRLHGWAEAQAERRGRDRRTAEERALALCTFAPQLNPPFPSGRSPSSGRGRGRGKHYALPLERAQRIAREWVSAAEVAAAAAAAAGPARPSDHISNSNSGGGSPSASGAPAVQSRVLSSRSLMHAASLAPEVHALGHHLVRQERARLLRREEELIRQGATRAGAGVGAAAAAGAAATAGAGAGRRSSSRSRPPAPTSAFSVAVASYGSRGYAHLHGSGLPQVDSPPLSPARAMSVPDGGAAKNVHVHHGAPVAWSAEDGANGALALGWSSPVCVDADADADAVAGKGAAADAGSSLDSVDVSSSDASPTLASSSVSAGQGRRRPAPLLTPGGGRGRAELLSPGSTLQQLCDLNLGTVVGTPSPMQSARGEAAGNGAGAAGDPAMMFPASPAPAHADSGSAAAAAADMVFPALRGGEDHAGEDDDLGLGLGPDSELHPPAESPPRLPSPKEQWEAGVLLERLRLEQARLAQLGRGLDAPAPAPVSQSLRGQQTAQWERRPHGEVQQQQQQQPHSSPQWAHTSPQHPPQHFLSPQQIHSPPISAAPLPAPAPAPVPHATARRSVLQSSLAAVMSNLPNLDALLHRTMLREMQQHASLEEAGFTFLGSNAASSLPQPSFAPPLVLVPVSAVASPAMRNRGSPGSSPWGSPGPSALSTPSLSAANAPLFAGRNGTGQRSTHGSAASTPVQSALAAHAPLPPSPLASLARLGPSSALQFGVPWPVEERRERGGLVCALDPASGEAHAVESVAHAYGATVRHGRVAEEAELQQQEEQFKEEDDASVSVGSDVDVEEDDGAEEEDEQQEQISDDDGDEAEAQR
jgi:hypothetical protein